MPAIFFKLKTGKKVENRLKTPFFQQSVLQSNVRARPSGTFLETLRKKRRFPVDYCPFYDYIIKIKFLKKQTRDSPCPFSFPSAAACPVSEPEHAAPHIMPNRRIQADSAPENTGNDDERDRF